ncbi:metallophosphoesterase [Paludibacterium yongneupense]|uniref:metallophosphoesterase n=1 Tax=Paludibacterium yongneupense TaxID=400061 RepID=UPI0004096412|nr:metallophosphoesterase [Paludibacterium yongneupense]
MAAAFLHLPRNSLGRDYVVGDIHGAFSLLERALAHIGFDTVCDRLLSVGDLIDRGPECPRVLDWLQRSWFFPVRGNHEQMALDSDPASAPSRTLQRMNGGAWLLQAGPAERKDYLTAFAAMPLAMEVDGEGDGRLGVVHADCPGGDWRRLRALLEGAATVPPALIQAMLWSRNRLCLGDAAPVEGVARLCVGHSILEQPQRLGNVVFLDTGAYVSGRFSLYDAAADRIVVYEEGSQAGG